jgi:formylmethanofuran--tetrahydromethanopterin N-formyltransferase
VKLGETFVEDTFAEAFRMRFTRILITAHDRHWLESAVREYSGYGSSIIACDAETGLEQWVDPSETPDGRVGASILAFGFSTEGLGKAVANRAGQCLMTCPTTAVFDGLSESTERIPLGRHLRYFGDGFQKSKRLAGRRYWRIPVMDGEFLIEDSVGVSQGVAGGNIILQAVSLEAGLAAARRAANAVADLAGVITPFPGGVARSGSKIGSRYKDLRASTSDAFCPTLRGRVETRLHPGVNCAYEIVMDGISEPAVSRAMATAMRSAAGEGIPCISAGNYGGKLGKHQLRLRELLAT